MSRAEAPAPAAVLGGTDLQEFVEAHDAAIAALGLLSEDVRDKDALGLLAVLRAVTTMRALVSAGEVEAPAYAPRASEVGAST